MGKQNNKFLKIGFIVISLFAVAACSSTSEPEEDSSAGEAASSSGDSTSATTTAGPNSGQLTQDEIAAQNALRQTVFYFDFDIAEFKSEDRDTLTYHARDLAANPGKRIRLEGHADERGTREYNLALGERRAKASRDYLVRLGIDVSRVSVISYGEERPVSFGHDEASWRLNRRGEFELQ